MNREDVQLVYTPYKTQEFSLSKHLESLRIGNMVLAQLDRLLIQLLITDIYLE